jgi:hypothetical protein
VTAPNPEADAKADAEAKAKAGRAKRGQVVHFEAVNAQTGETFEGFGVVTLAPDDGPLQVRPLADFDVQTDKAEAVAVDDGA